MKARYLSHMEKKKSAVARYLDDECQFCVAVHDVLKLLTGGRVLGKVRVVDREHIELQNILG